MKSSEPVFTRQNPFTPASSVRRPHYHPSRKQSLSKKEKETTLSPVRSTRGSSQQPPSQNRKTQQFHKNQDGGSAADEQHVFTEIWPSADSGSSPDSNTASPEMSPSKLSARSQTRRVSSGVQDEYIERFRHGRPRSREERRQMTSGEEQMPFWWMPPSSTFSPTKAPEKDDHHFSCSSPDGQHQRDRSLSILSDSSQGEFDDTDLIHLQEKASNLLLRGECIQSDGSVPVSSDGLGCSDFSSPVSVDEPVRRPLIPTSIKLAAANVSADSIPAASSWKSVIPVLAPPTRPEEDILFQWRLRRKMEEARERSQTLQHSSLHDSALSCWGSSLNHHSIRGQAHKQQQSSQPSHFPHRDSHPHVTDPQSKTAEIHRSCDPGPSPPSFHPIVVSGSSVSLPQALAHVPAHMHLLCDVLPCPAQSSHIEDKEIGSQRKEELPNKVVHKKTQVPENSSVTTSGEILRPSPHVSSETVEGDERCLKKVLKKDREKKLKEFDKKKTDVSIRHQRKSARGSSHQSRPKAMTSLKGQRGQERSRDHDTPPSPVHTALGQVVSEVLFPSTDSSSAQTIAASSPRLPHGDASPSTATPPSHNTQNSLEVISQLLQEAEDSDEKEFEEDRLLHVLRQQRKWVKDQISEVNTMLSEFPEEQQST